MGSSFRDLLQYRRLFQLILVLGIGGSFQIGFQLSMITYTSVHVKALLNETWLARSGLPLPTETLTLLWSFIVSIYGLGGFLGSMASGYLTQRYGKKKCLLGNNVVMLMSAFVMGFSKMASSFEMILAGRFLCGISAGLCIPLHPQYLGEISPKKLRGFTNSTASVFWSLGKAFGQILGQRELLGSASLWPLLMAFSGFTAAIQLLTLPFFPESPPHLLLHKGDEQGCLKAMKMLWGEGHHQAELEDLRKELATLKGTRSSSVWEVVKDPSLRWQVYTLLLLVITMQLSGINAIYFYTFEVLQTAGFDKDHIPYLSLGVSLCELLAAVMCSFIIERSGRKKLLWGGYWLMATVLAMVTLTLSLQRWVAWMPYCSLALLFCFVMCFAMGPAGATVSVRMEIFDQSSRSSAFVINGTLNWIGMFVIGMAFPFVVESLRQFSFLIFMVALYTSGLLIYLFLPETKNKSILEIREEFEKLNFKKKQVLALERNVTEERAFCTKL